MKVGGAPVYDYSELVGDVYQGPHVLMMQNGVLVGPINTGSNTMKVGASGAAVTNLLAGTATYNPPSLADAIVATTTVTVTGAVVGDSCDPGFTTFGTVGGIHITCQVSTTSVALVTFDNESTVTQDLATGTLKIWTRH